MARPSNECKSVADVHESSTVVAIIVDGVLLLVSVVHWACINDVGRAKQAGSRRIQLICTSALGQPPGGRSGVQKANRAKRCMRT
eukprot:scaffold155402_cov16-Tisochrysis_lutea.AAC.5